MANEDDFTFCRVGPPVDGIADDISGININHGNKKATDSRGDQNNDNIWKISASSQKQETIGSLSFSVIDASSRKVGEVAQEASGTSTKASPEQTTVPKKSKPRAKVPFEKGYSQVDWLKLTRTHPDLAGLKGQSNRRLISLSEVKQHQYEGSMWTVLKGRVYNIAPYMKFHPGGVDMLMKAVGKDCTSLFNKYHAWVNAEFLLEKCLVGILEVAQ